MMTKIGSTISYDGGDTGYAHQTHTYTHTHMHTHKHTHTLTNTLSLREMCLLIYAQVP
jgi:hypothetical protein